MNFRRLRSSDSPDSEGYSQRSKMPVITIQGVIAILVFVGGLGGVYAQFISQAAVQNQKLSELEQQQKEIKKAAEKSRQEFREDVRDVKDELKEIRKSQVENTQRILQELQRRR